MSPRLARLFAFVVASSVLGSLGLVMDGCGSDPSPVGAGGDSSTTGDGSSTDGSSTDGSSTDGGTDSATSDSATSDSGANGKGETCIGFAKGTPCGAGGFPDYGYVCFNGSPPGIAGCVLASSTGAFGDTWCCTENKCVAEPDQDTKECKAAGTPHRYQCPPAEADSGATVPPPSGCADGGVGGSALERFYCCP